jgi:hypothetical protein
MTYTTVMPIPLTDRLTLSPREAVELTGLSEEFIRHAYNLHPGDPQRLKVVRKSEGPKARIFILRKELDLWLDTLADA